MEFKLKKDDIVKIVSRDFFGSGLTQSSSDEYKVTDRRNTLGYNQYRLEGMSGWWHEGNLEAVQN